MTEDITEEVLKPTQDEIEPTEAKNEERCKKIRFQENRLEEAK